MSTDIDTHVSRIEETGYTIVEDAIDLDLIDALDDGLLRLEHDLGIVPADNDFEGAHTTRIYNLLAHGPAFEQIPVHPAILPDLRTGPRPGPAGVVPVLHRHRARRDATAHPRRRSGDPPAQAAPSDGVQHHVGPHRLHRSERGHPDHPRLPHWRPSRPTSSAATTPFRPRWPEGSVLVWHGSLWHGGGANTTPSRRVGIAMNYCAGYIRQQENQQLGLPIDTVRRFTPRLQQLVGYGIYRGPDRSYRQEGSGQSPPRCHRGSPSPLGLRRTSGTLGLRTSGRIQRPSVASWR